MTTFKSHSFKLLVDDQPAVVERLLRVIRHRGFSLQSFNLEKSNESLEIDFCVGSSRAVHLLFNQLEKLYNVKQISFSKNI